MLQTDHHRLYDWNHMPAVDRSAMGELSSSQRRLPGAIALHDETLRDGLQATSVQHPTAADKLRILHHAAARTMIADCHFCVALHGLCAQWIGAVMVGAP